jgi:hypothetical protein
MNLHDPGRKDSSPTSIQASVNMSFGNYSRFEHGSGCAFEVVNPGLKNETLTHETPIYMSIMLSFINHRV